MENTKMDKSLKIKWAVTFIIPLILWLIPSMGWYTGTLKTFCIITVFSLIAMAFEFWPPAVAPLLMVSLYCIFNLAPVNVILAPWASNMILMIIGGMVLAAELDYSGVLHRIAYSLMVKAKGSYFRLLMVIFVTGCILTIATFGNSYLIMGALCAGLCGAMSINRTKMGAGIATACMLGACTMKSVLYPVTTYAFILGSAGEAGQGVQVGLIPSLIHNFPMFLVCAFIVWLVSKWYKPEQEYGDTEYFENELKKLGKMKPLEKRMLGVLALVFIYMFTTSIHGLDISYGFALIPWLAFLPGIDATRAESLNKVSWQMVFFLAACMSIGTTAAAVGFAPLVTDLCTGIFQGDNIFVILLAIYALVFVCNFFMTPLAIWALISGPVLSIAGTMGVSKLAMVYCLSTCSELIVLPYEYPLYLMVFAFGMMTMKDFIKLNVMRSIVFFLGFFLILVPYWMLIGLV